MKSNARGIVEFAREKKTHLISSVASLNNCCQPAKRGFNNAQNQDETKFRKQPR
jgi:hypothetical protein